MKNNKKEINKAVLKIIGIIVANVLVLLSSAFFQSLFDELDIEIYIILGSSSIVIILLLIVFIIFFICRRIDYKNYGKGYVLLEELIIFRLGISYSDFKVSKKIKRKLNYFIEYSSSGNVGVIKRNGEEVVEAKYSDIYIPNPEKDVFICVNSEDLYTIVNSKGEEILKEYMNVSALKTTEGILEFEKEVLKFEQDGKYGLINLDGQIVAKAEYDEIKSLKNKPGKLLVKKDRKWGVMDITGEIIINPQFSELRFDGKNYMFEKDHSWGWCSASGEYIINPQYSKVRGFNGTKLAPARELHSYDWGYVDTKGNWVIAPQFKNAYSFNNYGLAIAKLGDDWGIINQKGKWVINPQYDFVYELKGTNQYIVSMDNEKSYMIINAKNEMVSNEQFVLDTEALINWEESIGYHMLENYGGVKTDYVDFSLVGDMLIEMAVSMQSTTSGAIKEKLGEYRFSQTEIDELLKE